MDGPYHALDQLVSRARCRDAEAAEALVEALYPVVMGVVDKRRPQSVDAEDIAQEVFLKMFRHLDSFRGGPKELEAWLRRTAFRTCLDHHRYRKSRPEVRWSDLSDEQRAALDAVCRPDGSATPAEQAGARELADALLANLAPKERLLFEMLELERLSLEEIERLTGWRAINVRVRVYRARRKLRSILAKLLDEHELTGS